MQTLRATTNTVRYYQTSV